jgi:hypothetical protein
LGSRPPLRSRDSWFTAVITARLIVLWESLVSWGAHAALSPFFSWASKRKHASYWMELGEIVNDTIFCSFVAQWIILIYVTI